MSTVFWQGLYRRFILFGGKGLGQVIVQIYEVQDRNEAEALIELGVDHIGSVLMSTDFPAHDPLAETMALVSECEKKSSLIPLFTDADMVSRALDRYQPDIVHFCEVLSGNGSETGMKAAFDRQQDIRKRFPEISIMRSIPIAQSGMADWVPTLDIARIFEPVSDYFLTDTLVISHGAELENAQPVNGFVGITGKTCDWEMAAKLVKSSTIPVILAGGISPENVLNGIESVKPAGVDSCTLTNAKDSEGRTIRFKKDLKKVKRLVDSVRNVRSEA